MGHHLLVEWANLFEHPVEEGRREDFAQVAGIHKTVELAVVYLVVQIVLEFVQPLVVVEAADKVLVDGGHARRIVEGLAGGIVEELVEGNVELAAEPVVESVVGGAVGPAVGLAVEPFVELVLGLTFEPVAPYLAVEVGLGRYLRATSFRILKKLLFYLVFGYII